MARNNLTLNISDEARLATVKTVLGYESAVRGLTIGQTFAQLITEAADLDSYPEEVRAQLKGIEDQRRVAAALKSQMVVGDYQQRLSA